MEENTNLNMETSTDEIIFDDVEETTETESNEEIETQEQTQEDIKPQGLKVKYNGVEQELSMEDAVMYAQKGMNYDKLKQAYDSQINSPTLISFNRQAKQLGMTPEEYINYLDDFQAKSLEMGAMKRLREQYPDANEEILSQLAQREVSDLISRNKEQLLESENERIAQEDAYWDEQINSFAKAYPDVDMENLPQEVINDMASGESLLSAYRAFENKQLREKLNALEINQANKKKAVGNISQDSTTEFGNDYFLAGLLGK